MLYERSVLASWRAANDHSPVTGMPMGECGGLVTVLPVQAAIREWCSHHGVVL
jgi:hypothetical protein